MFYELGLPTFKTIIHNAKVKMDSCLKVHSNVLIVGLHSRVSSHAMCRSMVDIQSVAAEIRRGIKKVR